MKYLKKEKSLNNLRRWWVLYAKNGEAVLNGEVYQNASNATRAEKDIITAMINALVERGYTVTKGESIIIH